MVNVKRHHPAKSVVPLIIILFFLMMAGLTHAATVTPGITLTTDNDSVYLGDTVVIEMEAVGILDNVDITALFKEADLLRETTGTRIAVVEERVVEVKLRRMEFLPRREGQIVFGPLQGEAATGVIVSNSLDINVLPATNEQWQPAEDDLQISVIFSNGGANDESADNASTDKPAPYSAYIGQRIIVDIELRHQHPIADEQLSLPDFDGFDVLTEYELRRTVEQVPVAADESSEASERWRVISWRYHLFAQRSGTLTFKPLTWRGLVIRSRTQRAEFLKQTEPQVLQIKPALPDTNWWLPSTAVSLSDSWSQDALDLSAGDEVFRTITLRARDVLASHLPDVDMLESRAISSTLVEQSRTQQLLGDHITATATFRYRLVAQSPIPVFLDTVRVPWYDTSKSIARESIIPARRINVGLPDRADLLAELALNDGWLERMTLELRTVANKFAYWHVSLLVLALIACWLLIKEIRDVIAHRGQQPATRGTSGLPGL